MTDVRKKLVELVRLAGVRDKGVALRIADCLVINGVTVQECCHKAESVISKTGLLCTACHSDIDRDAVFCKYCGAKVMLQPPKGE